MNPDEAQLIAKFVDPNADTIMQVLRIACYDEYRANAYYQKVIDTFGPVAPFSNIAQAEIRHYSAIETLCINYGVTPPVNDWYPKTVIGATPEACCADGVQAEKENIAMYDYLLTFVTQPDIRDVFWREQAASFNNHLPAFTRCLQQYQASQTPPAQGLHQHDLMQMIHGLATGNIDQGLVTRMIGTLANRDLLIGLALGAAATAAVTTDLFQSNTDKE